MATAATNLPCDGEGVCMACEAKPQEAEVLRCCICATPWHVPCLSKPPSSMSGLADWQCPDCDISDAAPPAAATGANAELVAAFRAIEDDDSLTEQEKARRRQAIVSKGKVPVSDDEDEDERKGGGRGGNEVLDLLDEKVNCAFCMQLPDRPVTSPCGHNFCLKCFQRWVGQGKRTCAKCRTPIPSKMATQPRINSALVVAIRMAKTAKSAASGGPAQVSHFIRNENRPEKAFTTDRAKRAGKANACSGQIFVTVPPDHFGPILAENDPKRNQGVLVGETWEDRMECRQWGAHLPHVAGIAGQSDYGAQSVALSGGYEDDEDHGEWFLYTGSGGRDLSGNKRTSKEQSFDQKFEKLNAALKVSCLEGYPVRVVRSHKEKRSSYAPEAGVRYDGVYRIEKCWRKVGIQGHKVCRYLFVRCDNEPAPWTSDEHGDQPRPLPVIDELNNSTDNTVRKRSPAWDYNSDKQCWMWMRPPPHSRKSTTSANPEERKSTRKRSHTSMKERLLKEFSCLLCRKVMTLPLSTPCGHNFCKACLLGAFADNSFMRERNKGGRTLRAQKIIKQCPSCPVDISDFLQNPQVNRDLMELIESLQHKIEEEMENKNGNDGNEVDKSGEESDGTKESITAKDIVDVCEEATNGGESKLIEEETSTVEIKVELVIVDSDNSALEKEGVELQKTEPQPCHKGKNAFDEDPDVVEAKRTELVHLKNDLSKAENSDAKDDTLTDVKENLNINVVDSGMLENEKALIQIQSSPAKQPVCCSQDRAAKRLKTGKKANNPQDETLAKDSIVDDNGDFQ